MIGGIIEKNILLSRLFAFGDSMTGGRTIRVLLAVSAQGKYPRGSDKWVMALRKALGSLDPERNVLLSSLGLPGWDLTTFLGRRAGFRMKLVVPDTENGGQKEAGLVEAFALDPERLKIEYTGGVKGKAGWQLRDRCLFELAEMIIPVSVRPGGRMERFIQEASSAGKMIQVGFEVPWSASNWRPRYDFKGKMPNPELNILTDDCLIHWTHASSGPWPGELPACFLADLLARPECYVRDALNTLAHIVEERIIRGSDLHMPGSECGVSLTSLTPAETIPLMRWRQRYVRYSLEPFGLAFRRPDMENLGARPVKYMEMKELRRTEEDRFFCQNRGRRTLWSAEQEWRLRGDIDFDSLSTGEPLLLAADPCSANELRESTGGRFQIEPVFLESVIERPEASCSDCPG